MAIEVDLDRLGLGIVIVGGNHTLIDRFQQPEAPLPWVGWRKPTQMRPLGHSSKAKQGTGQKNGSSESLIPSSPFFWGTNELDLVFCMVRYAHTTRRPPLFASFPSHRPLPDRAGQGGVRNNGGGARQQQKQNKKKNRGHDWLTSTNAHTHKQTK